MSILLDRRLRRALAALWWLGWLVILVACLRPQPELPFDLSDKGWHFLGFLAMSAGIVGFCHERRGLLGWAAFALFMGALIEVLQAFVPGRSSELADLLADAAGVAAGTTIALLWLRLVVERLRRPILDSLAPAER